MNETTILLSPSPGDPNAKPDFLATVEPTIPRRPPFALPFELVLDGYTREPWSSGGKTDDEWQSCYLASTDGRNRLPGFVKYLQGRKKAAVAKFESAEASSSGGPGRGILVVPYDPPPIPAEELPEGVDKSQVIFVKYLRDERILKKGKDNSQQQQQQQQLQKVQQKKQMHQQMMQRKKAQQPHIQQKLPPPQNIASGKKGGLLGNLLGAQRRTENHLHIVRSNKTSSDVAFDPNTGAAGCINAFRNKISAELEKFKSDPTTFIHKISIELPALVKTIPVDERDRVTMDVFKFTIYEQVEEVGMDRWVAAKEPSEFMDECVITVYKEGHCPPEVLEDLNRGELPDEIKGQAKHAAEAQSKAIQKKGKMQDEKMMKQSIAGGGNNNVVVLNTNKRDRRTVDQIQRDLQDEYGEAKKGRFD